MAAKVIPGETKDGGYIIAGQIHGTRRELDILAVFANGESIEEAGNRRSSDLLFGTKKGHN